MEEKMKFLEGRVKCRSIVECIMCGVFITGLTASIVYWCIFAKNCCFLSHLPYIFSSVICFTLLLVCVSKKKNNAEGVLLQLYSEKTEKEKLDEKKQWLQYHNEKAAFDVQLEIQKKIIDKMLGEIEATDKDNLDKLSKVYTELKNNFEKYKNNPAFQISLNDLINKDK